MRQRHYCTQECIPVGCVPSAAVAVGGGGVSQHALGRGVSAQGVSTQGGCVCIPARTAREVYPSMHWARGCIPVHAGFPTPPLSPRGQNS